MKFTRYLMTLLTLSSVTVAIAGENRWFAGKYRPAPASAVPVTATIDGGNRWFAGKYRPAAASSAPVHIEKVREDIKPADPKKT